MRRSAWLMLGLAGAVVGGCAPGPPVTDQVTIALARHAEKEAGDDPDLSAEGRTRARALAHALSEWRVDALFVSQYRRTQATAAPLGERWGLDPTVMEAADVAGLAQRLREARGQVVVIGHSNTVPEIMRALGVGDVPEIPEDQYDDLFVVRLASDGRAEMTHLKYGAPAPP